MRSNSARKALAVVKAILLPIALGAVMGATMPLLWFTDPASANALNEWAILQMYSAYREAFPARPRGHTQAERCPLSCYSDGLQLE